MTSLHRVCLWLCIALWLLVAPAARADKVDDYVREQMQKQHIPALSVAVIKDGRLVKAKGYGFANLEHKVPARPDTVYKIASVSKQLIAAGILLLAQDGKMSVDDPVSKHLEGTPESWSGITVRHLLTHTSGIVREAPGFDYQKVQPDAEVVKTAYPLPLQFAPGEKYQYCNVGYFALAEIIRKVSGKPWPDFLSERVFSPLGMTSSRATTTIEIVPNRASGYAWTGGEQRNTPDGPAVRPSGAFLSTVLDMAKWDAALRTDALFRSSTREQMWSPVRLNNGTTYPYGFGWSLDAYQGHKQIHHGGAQPGFRSEYARFPDDGVSVIVLTNQDGARPAEIARGVAGFYIPALAASQSGAARQAPPERLQTDPGVNRLEWVPD
jgi:D-alanyl-D-alanine carboxypeptidase